MAYTALYRQWRPQNFEGLIGQDHVAVTLRNAILSGKINHAYLFTGPRGTGKTSTAKVLAKALNCDQGPTATPCNQCPACDRINSGSSMDVYEIDAASNRGIDEIRDLRENVKFGAAEGRNKVYIIDEVHMLTNEAFNALLKTLEEPPAHVVFILATTEPHRIPATILSRCQRYDFRRVGVPELAKHLQFVAEQSNLEVDAEALQLIAIQADGGVRDAISMLDQCSVMSSGKITEEDVRGLLGLVGREAIYALMDALANHDGAGVLTLLDEQMNAGKDVRQVLLDLTTYGRSVMVHRAAPSLQNSTIGAYSIERLKIDGARFNHQAIVHLIEKTYKAANDARWSSDPRITAEMALLSLCSDTMAVEVAASPIAALQKSADKPVVKQAVVKTAPEIIMPETLVVATQVTASAKTKPTAELNKFWGDAREQLEKSGKRAVKAFLEDSTLESLEGGQALVVFKSANFKERFERDDYRTILEKVLSDLSGETIRLVCRLEAEKLVPVPATKAKAEQKVEIYPESVRKVHEMFGGQVIKQEDNKGEH